MLFRSTDEHYKAEIDKLDKQRQQLAEKLKSTNDELLQATIAREVQSLKGQIRFLNAKASKQFTRHVTIDPGSDSGSISELIEGIMNRDEEAIKDAVGDGQ